MTLPRGIYGMHEQCPTSILPAGWILHLAEVGSGTDQHPGLMIPDDGRTPIVRIQHSWGVGGRCIPTEAELPGYLGRVATLVRNTPNCHIWIPGNEPNVGVEGPFLPGHVARVYEEARLTIRAQAGHEEDQVLLPPVGPWNVETGIAWIAYFTMLTAQLDEVDGFALHTYSRGQEPSAVTSNDKMEPPYNGFYNGFRTYRDWMAAIPPRLRDKPVYITETNANDAWLDQNMGWVQAAYKEIDGWNRTPGNQQIRALILYRWPKHDKYNIEGKQGVIDDFLAAQEQGYTWKEDDMPEWTTVFADGFEGSFYDYQGFGELTCPEGWTPRWIEDAAQLLKRPEYDSKRASAGHPEIRTGQQAANFFSTWGKMRACLSQKFALTPGAEFRANVWAMGKFSGAATCGARLVADPNGGNDWERTSLPSSDWWSNVNNALYRDTWRQLTVTGTVGAGGVVTFFLQANTDDAIEHHGIHWDDFVLESTGTVVPPPPPPPPGPIFDDATALHAYAATLRTIAGGLDDVASRIGAGLPADARVKLVDAHRLLGEVLG